MPWSHCELEFILDNEDCPTCGVSKSAWTVELARTRTLTIGVKRKAGASWVDLELLDPRGRPAAGAAYEVRFANGRVVRGQLDDRGLARVPRPVPGACDVSFPGRAATRRRVLAGAATGATPRPAHEGSGLPPDGARTAAPAPAASLPAELKGALLAGRPGALRALARARRASGGRGREPQAPPGRREPEPGDAPLVLSRAQCEGGGSHYLFREEPDATVKMCLPLRVTFASREQARAWLERARVTALVDGEQVACGAAVRARDLIEVQLRVPPGRRRVQVVSEGRPRRVLLDQRLDVDVDAGEA